MCVSHRCDYVCLCVFGVVSVCFIISLTWSPKRVDELLIRQDSQGAGAQVTSVLTQEDRSAVENALPAQEFPGAVAGIDLYALLPSPSSLFRSQRALTSEYLESL